MRNIRIILSIAVAGLLAVSCGTRKAAKVSEPITIAYGGTAGSVGAWKMDQTFKGKILSGGMPQLMVIRAHASIVETVEEVGDDGWRKIRLATKMQPLEVNGMIMEMGSVPASIETVVMRSSNGDIRELEKAEGGKDVLAWVVRSLGSTFPLLPPTPVLPGDRWERRGDVKAPFGGVFESVTIGVFDGIEEVGGVKCARLKMEGGVNLTGNPRGAEVEVFRLEYRGVVRFDLVSGRVVDSSQTGNLNVRARMGKIPVEAMMIFESALKLTPDK